MDTANSAYGWTVGSLNLRSGTPALVLVVALVVLIPVAVFLARQLSVMRLGDAVAQGLGVSVPRVRTLTILLAVVLGALAVSLAGRSA